MEKWILRNLLQNLHSLSDPAERAAVLQLIELEGGDEELYNFSDFLGG